jgi:hypothetical protein
MCNLVINYIRNQKTGLECGSVNYYYLIFLKPHPEIMLDEVFFMLKELNYFLWINETGPNNPDLNNFESLL